MKTNVILSFGLMLALSACGGGGGSETSAPIPAPAPAPTIYTGAFLDSAVEGLGFETASQQGMTNDKGEFTYQAGEQVTFYIGGIRFPAIDAKEILTPLDVFNTDVIETTSVINMLRFLQTLDVDGVADNGIQLAPELHTLASAFSVNFDDEMFEMLVNALLVANNAINIALISEEDAIAHFRATLASIGVSTGNCDMSTPHSKVGYTGSFQTFHHNVSGNVTVVDNCTLRIDNFSYDGLGPDVYFYGLVEGDENLSEAFAMSEAIHGTVFDNETVLVNIPQGKSLDDFDKLSVWCVAASANFGEATLTAP